MFHILLLLQNGITPEMLDISLGITIESLSNLQSIAKGQLLKP